MSGLAQSPEPAATRGGTGRARRLWTVPACGQPCGLPHRPWTTLRYAPGCPHCPQPRRRGGGAEQTGTETRPGPCLTARAPSCGQCRPVDNPAGCHTGLGQPSAALRVAHTDHSLDEDCRALAIALKCNRCPGLFCHRCPRTFKTACTGFFRLRAGCGFVSERGAGCWRPCS
jgi:hypothetical protein